METIDCSNFVSILQLQKLEDQRVLYTITISLTKMKSTCYFFSFEIITTPGQSGPGRNFKDWVFHILQSFSMTGTSPSDAV